MASSVLRRQSLYPRYVLNRRLAPIRGALGINSKFRSVEGHRPSRGTSDTGSNFDLWDGQAGFGENAVHDFFRALVVLSMQSTAPASEFATQELCLTSGGIFLMLNVKCLQEV